MVRRQLSFSAIVMALLYLALTGSLYAQTGVPQLINYQGRLDSSGVPINGTRSMTFKVYSDSAGTNLLWTESNLPVPVTNGVFSVMLGTPTAFPAGLFTGSGDRFLGVTVGSGTEMLPRFRFTSVAYSMQAGTVASSGAITCSKLIVSSHSSNSGTFLSDSLNSSTYILYSQFTGAGTADVKAIYGRSVAAPFWGYGGYFLGGFIGALGIADTVGTGTRLGLEGIGSNGSGGSYGVYGIASSVTGANGYGIYGYASGAGTNYAGYFAGNVNVTGTLSKGGGSFKIDDPIDPANKYLYHSFVESPDMKNIYDGVAVLGDGGTATIQLPAWFDALNRDFRYQLTAIGAPAPGLYIAQEVVNNSFTIAGGNPGMKVSWQVTGIRKDAFANAHRIPVEEDKPASERGKYLYPAEQGQPETMGVDYQSAHPDKKGNQ